MARQQRRDHRPQSPVRITPPLPTRRNAELGCCVSPPDHRHRALLIVEGNQEQGLSWDLLTHHRCVLVLFLLARRRFAASHRMPTRCCCRWSRF